MNFTIPFNMLRYTLSAVLSTALEGGSNNWYMIDGVVEPTIWEYTDTTLDSPSPGKHWKNDYPLNPGGALIVSDLNDADFAPVTVDSAAIQRGFTLLIEKHPDQAERILSGDYDVTPADLFFQLCVFGEIVY